MVLHPQRNLAVFGGFDLHRNLYTVAGVLNCVLDYVGDCSAKLLGISRNVDRGAVR